jgi:hypothetical protein
MARVYENLGVDQLLTKPYSANKTDWSLASTDPWVLSFIKGIQGTKSSRFITCYCERLQTPFAVQLVPGIP